MFINCEIMERKERGKRVQMIQRERDGVFFVGKKHTAEGFLFYVCATASTWNPSEFFSLARSPLESGTNRKIERDYLPRM
jgi:hypothetical protein